MPSTRQEVVLVFRGLSVSSTSSDATSIPNCGFVSHNRQASDMHGSPPVVEPRDGTMTAEHTPSPMVLLHAEGTIRCHDVADRKVRLAEEDRR
jgi:hypothetical protein